MKRLVLITLAVFALAACTTFPTFPTPAAMASPGPGKYALSVERGKWFGLNSRPLGVYLDNRAVGSLKGGQALTIYVPPGRYTVAVHLPVKDVPAGNAGTLVVDVSATEKPILRANVSALGYGGWKLERVQ